jgi:hypothetical protein
MKSKHNYIRINKPNKVFTQERQLRSSVKPVLMDGIVIAAFDIRDLGYKITNDPEHVKECSVCEKPLEGRHIMQIPGVETYYVFCTKCEESTRRMRYQTIKNMNL